MAFPMTFIIRSIAQRSSAEAIRAANHKPCVLRTRRERKAPCFTYSDALTVYSFCPPEVWNLADGWLDRLAERK